MHENVRYQCELCDKSYKSKAKLRDHTDRYHEGKEFQQICPLCKGAFVNLKSHIRIVHEKKKPFGCDICNAHFSQKSKLQMLLSNNLK